ncbi:MAG: serine hydrolase domain-containing protein [Acidobacteriota bacterium]
MKKIKEIEQFLSACIDASEFAGAVYLVAQRERISAFGALGQAVLLPVRLDVTEDTLFDLASLTKPLVTAMLLAQFSEQGKLDLFQPVSRFLPEFATPDKQTITIMQLASHSAGFIAWRPFYALAKQPRQILELIASEELAYQPGTHVIYSDLGYIVLGLLLQRISGKPLDELARQMIFEPLGLAYTGFNPPEQWRTRIAASETGNEYERIMAGEQAVGYTGWRHEMIWGNVDDQNAFFLGGVAGHAGLFAPAKEVLQMARQFLPGSCLVKEKTLELFYHNFTPGCVESRSLGWWLTEVGTTPAGPVLPAESFGHTGFTGVSVWIAPHEERVYILLTNRTHPVYKNFNMNERRREFHRLAAIHCEF